MNIVGMSDPADAECVVVVVVEAFLLLLSPLSLTYNTIRCKAIGAKLPEKVEIN